MKQAETSELQILKAGVCEQKYSTNAVVGLGLINFVFHAMTTRSVKVEKLNWGIEKSMKKIDGIWKDGEARRETRARPTEREKERLGFWPLRSYKFRKW